MEVMIAAVMSGLMLALLAGGVWIGLALMAIGILGMLFQYFLAGSNSTLIMIGVCLFSVTLGMGFSFRVGAYAPQVGCPGSPGWRPGHRARRRYPAPSGSG